MKIVGNKVHFDLVDASNPKHNIVMDIKPTDINKIKRAYESARRSGKHLKSLVKNKD